MWAPSELLKEVLQCEVAQRVPDARVSFVTEKLPAGGVRPFVRVAGTVRYQEGLPASYSWPATWADHVMEKFLPQSLHEAFGGVCRTVVTITPRRVYQDDGVMEHVGRYVYFPRADEALCGSWSDMTTDRVQVIELKVGKVVTLVDLSWFDPGELELHAGYYALVISPGNLSGPAALAKAKISSVAEFIASKWRAAYLPSEEFKFTHPVSWWDAVKLRFSWLGTPTLVQMTYGAADAARACGPAVSIPHTYQWVVTRTEQNDDGRE